MDEITGTQEDMLLQEDDLTLVSESHDGNNTTSNFFKIDSFETVYDKFSAEGSDIDVIKIEVAEDENQFFQKLCDEINIIGGDWTKQIISEKNQRIVCINKLFLSSDHGCAKIEKQILVLPSCAIKLFVFDEEINPVELALNNSSTTPEVKIKTENGLQQFINWFNNVEICRGGPKFDKYSDGDWINAAHKDVYLNVWRHNNCPIILPAGSKNSCKLCRSMVVYLKKKEKKIDKGTYITSTMKLNVLREIKKDYMLK